MPQLGKTQLIHDCFAPNSQPSTNFSQLQNTIFVVHASYIIPISITSHSFSHFYMLALPFHTLKEVQQNIHQRTEVQYNITHKQSREKQDDLM